VNNLRLGRIALAGVLSIGSFGCRSAIGPGDGAADHIIFLSTRDGAMRGAEALFEIYRMNVDGSGVENLTRQPGRYRHLSLTPDGRTVIFEGTRDFSAWTGSNCPSQIWAMATDGSRLHQVTTDGCSFNPRLSPDGTLIAYDRGLEIWVIGIDGSGARNISHALPPVAPSCGPDPRWSVRTLGWASESRVMFQRHICGVGTTYYSVDTQGNGLTVLESHAPTAYLSPDGGRIAFVRSTSAGSLGELTVMNLDGSNVRTVEAEASLHSRFGFERSPWSPDGTRIYFANAAGHYVTDISGIDVRRIADSTFRAVFNGWSKRGDRLMFTQYGAATSHVHVMNADGTGLVNLTNSAMRNEDALWVPGH
jgi:Tol biopolymer transport system component